MVRLLDAHFEGVTRDVFERDLAGKDWALLIEEDGRLRGFSTLHLYETQHAGEAFTVVYSGDTIVERDAWGSSALARCWIGSVAHPPAAPSERAALLAAPFLGVPDLPLPSRLLA
jgi:hypothetical protein